ncbi:hypothetical protein J6590_010128 [Homalodisca vitripennis]|nr:hypothetical protein J6590_010128 [Homalodisca vitripennis]
MSKRDRRTKGGRRYCSEARPRKRASPENRWETNKYEGKFENRGIEERKGDGAIVVKRGRGRLPSQVRRVSGGRRARCLGRQHGDHKKQKSTWVPHSWAAPASPLPALACILN